MAVSRKILYCATVDYHFKAFHLPYMNWFQEQGFEVHIAAKGEINLPYCNVKYNIPIERAPFKRENLTAYKELKRIIDENNYDIIHIHTPMAGVIARLAAKTARKKGIKILYTAHGFHFYKGAPLLNWIVYYPIERILSRYTDGLITINSEDYNLAIRHKFKAKNIYHVHGVGVDSNRFIPADMNEKLRLREKNGYKKEDFILCYVAELNKNKNQGLLLKVTARVKEKIPNLRLLLIGEGILMASYRTMAKDLGIEDNVDFLGFRKDVDEIIKMSDIAVGSSFREGLPVNIMEAMACEKPIIVTDNRGHRELIKNNYNGFIVDYNDEESFTKKVYELYYSQPLREYFSKNAAVEARKYSLVNVKRQMRKIYEQFIGEEGDINEVSNKSFTCSS